MKIITRTIWVLSLVSLFTDIASEMLYPILPLYLKSIGFSIVLIGVLEGFAEAIAGLSKGYFGQLSDNLGKRLPFIKLGYMFSAMSKPMMAIFTYPAWIFSARTIDRIGKGVRTGARDALLSDEATPQTKGRVFGFHRSMDTIGAVVGPILALIFLYFNPGQYKTLFYVAFLPGIIAICLTFLIKDRKPITKENVNKTNYFDFIKYWKRSPPTYRKLVIGLLIFTLFNSSDVFLLLKIRDVGYSDAITIELYIFYNIICAVFAFPLGIVADRIGLKSVFVFGLLLFAIVYIGMAVNSNLYIFFLLFFLYGIYAAATEGIAKAWISNISFTKDTATAIGTFAGFQSICTMVASSLAGLLWFKYGAPIAFACTSVVTLLVIAYLLAISKTERTITPTC